MIFPNGWIEENNFLVKTFEFENFVETVNFVNKIVPIAEELNHHPDIEIFSYKKLKIRLSTHSVGKVTEKDLMLAEKINCLWNSN